MCCRLIAGIEVHIMKARHGCCGLLELQLASVRGSALICLRGVSPDSGQALVVMGKPRCNTKGPVF